MLPKQLRIVNIHSGFKTKCVNCRNYLPGFIAFCSGSPRRSLATVAAAVAGYAFCAFMIFTGSTGSPSRHTLLSGASVLLKASPRNSVNVAR